MKPESVKAVFFDAGHTLLRAHPSVGEIYSQETEKFGAQVEPQQFEQEFRAVFKKFVPEYVSNTKNRRSSNEQDATMWREITRRVYNLIPEMKNVDYEDWFLALYHKFAEADVWKYYDDVKPTLAALRKRGLRLGVISNWDTRLRKITVEMGLAEQMDFVLISAEVGVRKPDPGIFQRALATVGVRPEEAMHVGDLYEEDVLGAHGAGVFPVLLDRHERGTPSSDFPMWTVNNLSELVPRLS